jgi:two-component system sensor histidine kinase RegB
MPGVNPLPGNRYSASTRNLKSLLIIRSLVITGMLVLLWYLDYKAVGAENFGGMLGAAVALGLVTLASFARLSRQVPVTDLEYALQLCADILGLSIFLYFSGGANNPFVSYYLVPLVIAAAVLPRSFTACIALLCTAAYSLLLFRHVPLPLFAPQGHGSTGALTVHVVGMWVNFLVSVGLITWFVVNMASALRRQEQGAVEQREDSLRNDQVLAVAGLAAGTAHELGTPLATMSVVIEDLLDMGGQEEHGEDYRLLAQQLQRCKAILGKLARTAELTHIG